MKKLEGSYFFSGLYYFHFLEVKIMDNAISLSLYISYFEHMPYIKNKRFIEILNVCLQPQSSCFRAI